MSITLTWRNINCTQHNGVITHFGVQYHWKLDGVLVMMNIENSNTTNYTVDGLLPFTEYRFRIAGVNSEGPGPYTAFIGPIRTNEDGRLNRQLSQAFWAQSALVKKKKKLSHNFYIIKLFVSGITQVCDYMCLVMWGGNNERTKINSFDVKSRKIHALVEAMISTSQRILPIKKKV